MSFPPPLVPGNVDLRSMPDMPLEVALLRDASVTVSITDSAFKAAVLLWAAAWHEVPAASLPDDDKMLAKLAGYGRDISGWLEIRQEALWKFVKCSDGRLYHPVIAEKAIRVWEYRQDYRRRMAEARKAKAEKNGSANPKIISSITGSITDSMTDRVTGLNQTKPNCLRKSTSLAVGTRLSTAALRAFSKTPT